MSDRRPLRERATGAEVERATPPADAPVVAHATIADRIEALRPQLAEILPSHLGADRMAQLALTLIRKTPDLAQCTPASFLGGLFTAAQLGLEPGGPTGEAWLIPRKNKKAGTLEAQFQVGYQGWVKLWWQHPLAGNIEARAVYEADEFDYAYGTGRFLRHRPSTLPAAQRGAVTHYYATAELTTGAGGFLVLTPEEVREIRGGAVGGNGGVADPQRWMERKTVLTQLLKTMPRSTQLARALDADLQVRRDLRPEAIDGGSPANTYPEIEAPEANTPPPADDNTTTTQPTQPPTKATTPRTTSPGSHEHHHRRSHSDRGP